MACNHKRDVGNDERYEVKDVVLSSEEEVVSPPPPEFKTHFKTLQDWLVNICISEKPQKQISTYNFGLFEGQDNYIVYLTGINTHVLSQTHSETTIDFAPTELYFPLPQNEYKDLNRQQVLERLSAQLIEFTKTNQFRNSFFHEAKSIKTEWEGEIWRK